MPSTKDPNAVVKPSPGKLAAGEVHASSLAFPLSGTSAGLAAHLADPSEAHKAAAISIPDYYTLTGEAIRSVVGGPYDGDNVLDALNALKDLLPVKPDRIGFDNSAVPNDGLPDWPTVTGTVVRGGFTRAGAGIVTKYLTQSAAATVALVGTCFPADRGVLALYHTTAADFFNAGQTTLVAALWLGASPAPAGLASAAFDSSAKTGVQPAVGGGGAGTYTPTGAGLDLISLSYRVPYSADFAGFSPAPPFSDYTVNFSNYQLCRYAVPVTLTAGDSGSYLLVHWKESYATSLAAVQPAALTALTLVNANCYSAIPADGASIYENAKRSNVFLETTPAGPTGATITTSPAGTLTTIQLSGVAFYSSTGLQFNVMSTANDFFQNSYFTNSVASVSVPSGYESPSAPVEADLTDFGGALHVYQLYDEGTPRILNNSGGAPYTLGAPPTTSDVVRFQHAAQPVGGSGLAAPYPYGQVRVNYNTPFAAPVVATDTKLYLYNTLGASGSSTTVEGFADEQYRYPNSFSILATSPMLPAAPYDSTQGLGTLTDELQVYSGNLVYPTIDFSAAAYRPAGGPNYAAVLAADAANHIRRYQRVFDTGIARNTGTLTLSGLAFSSFQTSGVIDPAELTDHPGGAIVQIKVPGQTGWLDLGRVKGDPGLATTDFYGCRTGISGSTYTYDTTAFTADNGSGQFLIIVRVSFIKNGVGETLACGGITWSP